MKKEFDSLVRVLSESMKEREAVRHAEILFEEIAGLNRLDIALGRSKPFDQEKLSYMVDRIKEGVPIQHLIGFADFYGRKYKVTNETLIPRQETEELVDLMLRSHGDAAFKALDIGTGTGIIPISLKLERPGWKVSGLDVSLAALSVARENSQKLLAEVEWIHHDILSDKSLDKQFDLIVSNPPYITKKEKLDMDVNVLDHDPALALFVPDEDPLLFYRRIGEFGLTHLKNSGSLYFEINEHFGHETKELLEAQGYSNVKIHHDLNGKHRMISSQLIDF